MFALFRLKIKIVFFWECRYIDIQTITLHAWKERGYSNALKMLYTVGKY
jgi:hypothetical protein